MGADCWVFPRASRRQSHFSIRFEFIIGRVKEVINDIGDAVETQFTELSKLNGEQLKTDRIKKFFNMGEVKSMPAISPFRSDIPIDATWNESWEEVETSMGLK